MGSVINCLRLLNWMNVYTLVVSMMMTVTRMGFKMTCC